MNLVIVLIMGVLAGTITGLIPGIHVNLINSVILSSSFLLLVFQDPTLLPVFIVAMSVTHTFIDSIPSVFLGAPDSAMALGVLPGHRYLLQGFGRLAVKLTLLGSLFSVVFSLPLFFLFVKLGSYYPVLSDYIPHLLVLISLIIFLQDKKKKAAFLTYVLAGTLGILSLKQDNGLFPMLSGLFGVSTLLYSLKNAESPKTQKVVKLKVKNTLGLKAAFASSFAGGMTGLLPGIGSSAAAIIAQSMVGKIGDKGFMILVGGANTANFVLSLATWYAIDKARNGSVVAVSSLVTATQQNILALLFTALLASGLAVLTAYLLLKKVDLVFKIPYRILSSAVIVLIVVLTLILSDLRGLLILFTATTIGLLPATLKCRRSHAMACLILPVIIYAV